MFKNNKSLLTKDGKKYISAIQCQNIINLDVNVLVVSL